MGLMHRIVVIHNINYLHLIMRECLVSNIKKLIQFVSKSKNVNLDGKSRLSMRYTIGKILIIIVGILLSVTCARKIYRFTQFGIPITFSRPTEPSLVEFQKATSFPIIWSEENQTISYDFKKLVDLFCECEKIKRDFYKDFTPYFARQKEFDAKNVDTSLITLYRERNNFAQHVADIKGRSKQNLSIKRRRSLTYYQGVIQRHIDDLERIKKIITETKTNELTDKQVLLQQLRDAAIPSSDIKISI